MSAELFLVTSPSVDYNDQTYDVYPSRTIIYVGSDRQRAEDTLEHSAARLASNWSIEDLAAPARKGRSSALDVFRASHGFFSQVIGAEKSELVAVFGPTCPVDDGWGGATSYGVECWGVTTPGSVLDVVAAKRDKYKEAYAQLCPGDAEAIEYALDDLVITVSAVDIDPWGTACAV